ncbi:uncharacterized protein LOC128672016 [Plodia interpunctella]|uniref:uncharacterized protein LOC128672016 n=1 Tax=Plodia interpunctella TaxID=58824 RepID=UPI00236760EB|nr:uncharacterized protein LOC128672016 [Plodia interpunctella]
MTMGGSARIFAFLLLTAAVAAIPAGNSRQAYHNIDDAKDLNAESSEIISEAVAPPAVRPQAAKEQDTEAAADETDHSLELIGNSQNFFPSFANLFEPRPQNNFRLGFGNEGAYSQRPNSYRSLLNYPLFGNYRNAETFGKQGTASSAPLVEASSSVLGSGNFGIIKGGTFFAQNDEDSDYNDGFSSFYNNGHGRPSIGVGYIANPRPNYNQDQFANFRDFADINTPSNTAFSHYVVVYANKNATMDEISEETRKVLSEPKNIIETLQRLDEPVVAPPKISKAKAKLEATKQKMLSKKEQWKKKNSKFQSPKHDPEEPLLALS